MSLPIPRLKKMVEYILDENPKFRGAEARNSDIALTIIIWQRWYNVGTNDDSTVHLYRLFDLPREDNVKRVRAVFQNEEGKYLPTDWKVAEKRGIEREKWEAALGYKLSGDEMRVHMQTVKETTPPQSVRSTAYTNAVAEENLKEPVMTIRARYSGPSYRDLVPHQVYEIEVGRLEVGRPIKMYKPVEMTYPGLAQFNRAWGAV